MWWVERQSTAMHNAVHSAVQGRWRARFVCVGASCSYVTYDMRAEVCFGLQYVAATVILAALMLQYVSPSASV
jgi:hypothetical protein